MKVRYEWEPKDIKGGTRLRSKSGVEEIIGYRVELRGERRYVLIDLRDGAVLKAETKNGLAKSLTEHHYVPDRLEIQGESDGADE